jgi:Zn-dependent alcohol dehydrogenase
MMEINFGGARGTRPSPVHLSDGSSARGQFFGQSSLSELAIVDARSVVKYSGSIEDLPFLAPIGCGYQTGAGTILNVLRPKHNHSVAIFGLGAVGFSALMAAKSLNVARLIAVDIVDMRLELATTFGATHTINPRGTTVYDALRAISPEGIDFIIDTTGLGQMLSDGVRALGQKGTLAVVGTPRPSEMVQINALDLLMSCKSVIGVIEGDSNPSQLSLDLLSRPD